MATIQKVLHNRVAIFFLIIATIILLILTAQYLGESRSTITGTFTLHDSQLGFSDGESCEGSGGYEDIYDGAQVTISNGAGEIIAVSSLENSQMDGTYECVFEYTMKNVPRSDIYQLEVSNRGKITYSHSDLKKNAFVIDSSLGN